MSNTTTFTITAPSAPSSSTGTRLSASCQSIVAQDLTTPTKARVVIHTNLHDPDLLPSITAHKCNNVALTSSAHYADMAAVVASYIWRADRGQSAPLPGINVCDMHVEKTYIVNPPQEGAKTEGQWLEMEARVDVSEYSSLDLFDAEVTCHFRSIRPNGTKLADLGHCIVRYEWADGWLSAWSHHTALIRTKISNLRSRAQTERSGDVQLVYKEKAYEMFKSFVDYGAKYHNMSSVIFSVPDLEATATHVFQPDPTADYVGPYYLDGSCHVSGFVCNAVEQDTDKNAHISHGWDCMRLSPKFHPGPEAKIETYVRMQPLAGDSSILAGHVYVLQEDEIVGVWEGVKFKKIPRRVLNIFLPPGKKA